MPRRQSSQGPRPIPKTAVIEPPEGWRLLACGWDYWQETLAVDIPDDILRSLDEAREHAAGLDDRGDGRCLVKIAGEEFQVQPYRMRGGISVVLENDDMIVMLRTGNDWSVSIRQRAGALWEHGLAAMRARGEDVALALGEPIGEDWRRLSRCDFAFDVWAPPFREEMAPDLVGQVVQHSSSKEGTWGRRGELETVYMGSIGSLQATIYDKGLEVAETPEKSWMRVAWKDAGIAIQDDIPRKAIWRAEFRFGKEYLDARSLHRPSAAYHSRAAMVTEAIWTKRLTRRERDTNRNRWPLHPLWAICWEAAGRVEEMPPLGRIVSAEAMTRRADQLRRQIAGTARSLTVLTGGGEYTDRRLSDELAGADQRVRADPRHDDKVAVAKERYRYIFEAG